MIKLTKSAKPGVLEENAATWTKTLVDKISAGEKPTDSEKVKGLRKLSIH